MTDEWFDQLVFVPARTMPEQPHEYVRRTRENEAAYVQLFETIREHGVRERWKDGRSYRYWYRGDGFKYWAMTTALSRSWIINRAKL